MADFFVELGQNPTARNVIKTLGLPIPMPAKLEREVGPWQDQPLFDRDVVVCAAPQAELTQPLADALASAGANPYVTGEPYALEHFEQAGEAWGRPPVALDMDEVPEGLRPHALVLDATGIMDLADLRALYDFFQPRMRSIGHSGRVVVLGRAPERRRSPGASAAAAALEGFVRSVGREIGRNGATANLVYVQNDAEDRVAPVLRWLLSPRSAFVDGQPIRIEKGLKPVDDVPRQRPLENKVALVTGAARGIGRAIARAFAREGAHVIVLDRPQDDGPASEVAREVGGSLLLVDVTDPEAPGTIARHVDEHHDGIDIVVHNAGVTRDKTLKNMDEGRWDLTLGVNLEAPLAITEALDPHFREGGRVICLSSIAGIAGNVGQTNYAASKAGIIGFVEGLAPSLKKRGIGVNAVAPGFIETRLTDAIPVATREVARRLSNLGQGGLPEDVAEVITFLASPGSHGLTGQILRVCGGAYVGA